MPLDLDAIERHLEREPNACPECKQLGLVAELRVARRVVDAAREVEQDENQTALRLLYAAITAYDQAIGRT